MRGFTSTLWPIRYKPLPDELLSCWLVRLAHGHGLKVQTFCNLIFGNQRQVWNRDIDRLAPSWLIDELSCRTATSLDRARRTTLHAYEGALYRKFKAAGALQWILTLKLYHRKRQGYGLQYCPKCLTEDIIPYYRKRWRVAFYTVCTKHHTMMLDRCPQCAAALAFHRLDITNSDALVTGALSYCHECEFDLRNAPAVEPARVDSEAMALLFSACNQLEPIQIDDSQWNLGLYSVLHHLSMLLTSRYRHVCLRKFVQTELGINDIPLTPGRLSLEMRSVRERHYLIQLAMWLLVSPENRIERAWRSGAVRYNVLLKDFIDPPDWYLRCVQRMADWRSK